MISASSVPVFIRNRSGNNKSSNSASCNCGSNNNKGYVMTNDKNDDNNDNDATTDNDDSVSTIESVCDVVPVLYPYKKEMTQDRRINTAIGTTAAMAIGGLVSGPFFPIGMVVGATVGAAGSSTLCHYRQQRKQKRWEDKNYQNYINSKQNQVILTGNEFC